MRIAYLIDKIKIVRKKILSPDLVVNGISDDSRKVGKDYLFIAVRGFEVDGHNYIKQAVENGASCVIAEDESRIPEGIDFCIVENTREIAGILANKFYGNPSDKIKVVGVTGTNGKTTTTYLLESIFKECTGKAGLIGTIEYRYGDVKQKAFNTTPSAIALARMLSEMVQANIEYAVMEVSSHSIDQKRVAGIGFVEGIYTNLSQDHLNYHKTLEEYAEVKKSFFTKHIWCQRKLGWGDDGLAVLNADDSLSDKIMKAGNGKYVTYGVLKKADFNLIKTNYGAHKTELVVNHKGKEYKITTGLLGKFNAYNILASFATGISLGLVSEAVIRGIEIVDVVPGRFEKIDEGQDFLVIIDYSHTPDSLSFAIDNSKTLSKGKVITIFGCGGERDKLKRPIMGKIAGDDSDYCIITNDNPRTEDPEVIINAILKGIKESNLTEGDYEVIADREQAIRRGVEKARSGDVLLIAGKGHEDYQIIGKKRFHFDDKEVVRKYLKKLINSGV